MEQIISACEDELEELVKIASSVYINIGTLDNNFISLSKKATELAIKYGKHIIFDPVGCGVTKIRTQTAKHIACYSAIIRGNASEIIALNEGQFTGGIEAIHTTNEAKETAKYIALNDKATVIVSGDIDFITNGIKSTQVKFGSPLMQLVTGMGCAMTAVVAAFKAVMDNPFEAATIGAYYFALCGEVAARDHKHPGAFKIAFLDQLYRPNMRALYEKQR